MDVRHGRVGVARIVALRRALRIDGDAVLADVLHDLEIRRVGVEVRAPLPDVARHVVEPEAVGREALDRRRALEAVGLGVVAREVALEGVAAPWLSRLGIHRLVAPDVALLGEAAARGVLPLGLGRQTLARPLAVRDGVVVGDLRDGEVVLALDRALRSLRVTPAGARRPRPPVVVVIGGLIGRGRREHERTRHEHLVGRLGRAGRDLLLELLPVDRSLGDRLVARRVGKRTELRVGDLGRVDPEAVDMHLVLGGFVLARERIGRAHDEVARGDPAHAVGGSEKQD